ncbi:hypothetical protein BDF14DRAFT_1775245 [Spinellus fusiger]|nr:hypothetical protein BDF14DRAFT_1775245 [Spinellus fusiger]
MSARLARPLEATKVSLNRLGLHSTQRTLQPTRLLRPTQRFYGTREESRRTAATFGPFTWKAATAFITTGAALLVYFDYEKKSL